MELDDFKNIWGKEIPAETPEISLEKQKVMRMPLEKIRTEMLSYYNTTMLGLFILIGSFFLLFDKPSADTTVKALLFIFIYLIVTFYYFRKFYLVYKKLGSQSDLTRIFLEDLRLDLRISLSELKSYLLFSLPMVFAEFLIILPTGAFADLHKIVKLCCVLIIVFPYAIYMQLRRVKKSFEKPIEDLEYLLKNLKAQ